MPVGARYFLPCGMGRWHLQGAAEELETAENELDALLDSQLEPQRPWKRAKQNHHADEASLLGLSPCGSCVMPVL